MTAAAIRPLSVFIGYPAYAGNSGGTAISADIQDWSLKTITAMKADPRVGPIYTKVIADTPITMVRNKFVTEARKVGAHVLVMIDSDQNPQKHEGESWYKPFWKEAFDTIYAHYDKGPLVVGAPYAGPPDGGESCYVFHFTNRGDRGDETAFRLEMYDRNTAAVMSGVQECAALPTGLIMFDMRIFDVFEPPKESKSHILDMLLAGTISKDEALRNMSDGWFYYEWKDGYADEKASTEDVATTRDMSIGGIIKLGYNPLRCAWDSWIGHHKPMCVGKPSPYTVDNVGPVLQRAVLGGLKQGERIQHYEASPEVLNLFKVA